MMCHPARDTEERHLLIRYSHIDRICTAQHGEPLSCQSDATIPSRLSYKRINMSELINWLPPGLASLPRYVVALAIGLLMGLERERNPAAKAGLRTFALTALMGVLTAHLATALGELWLIAVGLFLVGAMMIAAYLHAPQQPDGDPGTTTVAALMLCYGLGVLVWHDEIQLAVMLGITATLLLYFKPELRGLSQQ